MQHHGNAHLPVVAATPLRVTTTSSASLCESVHAIKISAAAAAAAAAAWHRL